MKKKNIKKRFFTPEEDSLILSSNSNVEIGAKLNRNPAGISARRIYLKRKGGNAKSIRTTPYRGSLNFIINDINIGVDGIAKDIFVGKDKIVVNF